MKGLRYTLKSDGPTDARLLPVLNWLFGQHLPEVEIRPQFADLRQLPQGPPKALEEKIRLSLQLFPCDVLFVHRDAEKEDRTHRAEEIAAAMATLEDSPRHILVVPVRMSEAWLLIDESAIRRAAGNPNGRVKLKLPAVKSLERDPDPKETLEQLLREACELKGRRRTNFNVQRAKYQVAAEIDDFSPLRLLPAFQLLESDIRIFAAEWNENNTE
jgi:hypothetical protein